MAGIGIGAFIEGARSQADATSARAAQESANQASAHQAFKARQHDIYMTKNQHQFAVQDLRKAGLNPILAAGGGNTGGTSAMGVAQAASQNPAQEMASKVQMLGQIAQIGKMKAETKNINATTAKTVADTNIKGPIAEISKDIRGSYKHYKKRAGQLYQKGKKWMINKGYNPKYHRFEFNKK